MRRGGTLGGTAYPAFYFIVVGFEPSAPRRNMSGIKAGALGCFRACVCGTDFAVHAVAIGYPSTTASCRAKTKPKGVVRRGAVTGGGWTAVGDAAGRVDPITGEGIYYTLRSGDLAAQS